MLFAQFTTPTHLATTYAHATGRIAHHLLPRRAREEGTEVTTTRAALKKHLPYSFSVDVVDVVVEKSSKITRSNFGGIIFDQLWSSLIEIVMIMVHDRGSDHDKAVEQQQHRCLCQPVTSRSCRAEQTLYGTLAPA